MLSKLKFVAHFLDQMDWLREEVGLVPMPCDTSGTLREQVDAGIQELLNGWMTRHMLDGEGTVEEGLRALMAKEASTLDDPFERVLHDMLQWTGMPPADLLEVMELRCAKVAAAVDTLVSATAFEQAIDRVLQRLNTSDGKKELAAGHLDDALGQVALMGAKRALSESPPPAPDQAARQRFEEKLSSPDYQEEYRKLLDAWRGFAERHPESIPGIRHSLQASRMLIHPHTPEVVAEYDLLREDLDAYLDAMEKGEVPLRASEAGDAS